MVFPTGLQQVLAKVIDPVLSLRIECKILLKQNGIGFEPTVFPKLDAQYCLLARAIVGATYPKSSD